MTPRPHHPTPVAVSFRASCSFLLAAALAAAPLAPAPLAGQPFPPPSDSVTSAIMHRLSVLAADSMEGRRTGTPGSARARAYLVQQLTTMGARPVGASFEHPFRFRARGAAAADSMAGVNLVARIPGRSGSGRALVLSAHYDHLGVRNGEIFNGADDDASGCVALLTVAERLMRTPPQHDVVLVFFDAEEMGLQGARAFVSAPPIPLESIAANINLDMVARQDAGALWVAGTSHYPFLKPLAEAASAASKVTVRFGHDTRDLKPGDDWTGSSDHGAFHAKGIPFLYLGVEDHPDYHQPGDDVDKVDPAFYRRSVEFAAALVRQLDGALATIRR
ncbi:M20/M25/M40 family metallo-hydrolase [Gemmatimonas sp.]|uniref:M20/M25/M40 family metallo-hydrolase n=1 Tax=Gemmatimonas sp. TaxID=1962908 RepID=UPI0025BF3150|nr:M20/M25/M40 family metallo-hydrolase [Gemmatimonas sp.]MCA2993242.1 M20/M25/M40 family metallo-hydrolase [Gemmatimonas sp.]